jgi:hypothetical protein
MFTYLGNYVIMDLIPVELLARILSYCYAEICWHVCWTWRKLVNEKPSNDKFFDYLCEADLKIIQWAKRYGYDYGASTRAQLAIMENDMDILQWLHDNEKDALEDKTVFCDQIIEAARKKNLEAIEIVLSGPRYAFPVKALILLIKRNNLFFIKKLRQIVDLPIHRLGNFQSRCPLFILKWLRKRGMEFNSCIMKSALVSGDLEKVKWLRSQGAVWYHNDWGEVCSYGQIEILQYMWRKTPPRFRPELDALRFCSAVNVIKWIDEKNDRMDLLPNEIVIHILNYCHPQTYHCVCRGWRVITPKVIPHYMRDDFRQHVGRNWRLSEWLLDQLNPEDPAYRSILVRLTQMAPKENGYWMLDSIQKKHPEIISDYFDHIAIKAAKRQDGKILDWCIFRQLPLPNVVMNKLIKRGNLQLLKNCRLFVGNWTMNTDIFWIADNIPVLKWLRKHGMPIPSDAVEVMVHENNLSVLKWLRTQGMDIYTQPDWDRWKRSCWDDICAYGDAALIEWMWRKIPTGHTPKQMKDLIKTTVYKKNYSAALGLLEVYSPINREFRNQLQAVKELFMQKGVMQKGDLKDTEVRLKLLLERL